MPHRKRSIAVYVAMGIVIGLVISAIRVAVGGAAGTVLGVLVGVSLYALFIYVFATRWLPRRVHALYESLLDPAVGPPGDAEPTVVDVVDRVTAALNDRDWPAVASALSDDYELTVVNGRVYGRRMYLRTMPRLARIYPDLRIVVEQVVARPGSPETVWVRSRSSGTPRSGPALDVTCWVRTTLDGGAERLRAEELTGVVHMT